MFILYTLFYFMVNCKEISNSETKRLGYIVHTFEN